MAQHPLLQSTIQIVCSRFPYVGDKMEPYLQQLLFLGVFSGPLREVGKGIECIWFPAFRWC